jgi:hypothetical protein
MLTHLCKRSSRLQVPRVKGLPLPQGEGMQQKHLNLSETGNGHQRLVTRHPQGHNTVCRPACGTNIPRLGGLHFAVRQGHISRKDAGIKNKKWHCKTSRWHSKMSGVQPLFGFLDLDISPLISVIFGSLIHSQDVWPRCPHGIESSH